MNGRPVPALLGTAAFLAEPHCHLVGDHWPESKSGETNPVIHPATGATLASFQSSNHAAADDTVEAANGTIYGLRASERTQSLRRAHQLWGRASDFAAIEHYADIKGIVTRL